MIRFSTLIISLLLTSVTIQAGEYADAFILSTVFPHTQSMGLSTVAAQVSSGHALNNPAGFIHSRQSVLSLVYDQFNGLSSNYSLEFQTPVKDKYVLGFTLMHSGVSDLHYRPNLSGLIQNDRRDSVLVLAGQINDPIGYREDAVFISIAKQYEFEFNLGWKFFKIPFRVPVGMSIKYIDKMIVENRGLGSGFDLGAQAYFDLGGMTKWLTQTEFSVGLVINDILNTPVYWSTKHQDAIKRNYTKGYSIRQVIKRYDLEVLYSRSSQTRYSSYEQHGLEIRVKDFLSLRAGHDGFRPAFGLGIALKKFIIAYSFSQHDLAGMQNIEINYHF